jgi:hypothetical protein
VLERITVTSLLACLLWPEILKQQTALTTPRNNNVICAAVPADSWAPGLINSIATKGHSQHPLVLPSPASVGAAWPHPLLSLTYFTSTSSQSFQLGENRNQRTNYIS